MTKPNKNLLSGPLAGVRVLDLSRILAGPTCTQLLGDLGADIIKIENPAAGGDDTRQWGPPYVETQSGISPTESAYYLAANRNKRSIALDITSAEGQAVLHDLAADSDILIENFKAGGLAKYGLAYSDLQEKYPKLVYCSISGFGQTGPNSNKPGYDLMAQGYGGIMSLTGEAEGDPIKVGVGIADIMCGMYAAVGILSALRYRDLSGRGQHIDLALVDSQVAWLANEGTNYLLSGQVPIRRGNAHPNIVPYQVFQASDGHVIIAVGNDSQFSRFCHWLKQDALATDPNFKTNPARLENREQLISILIPILKQYSVDTLISGMENCKVPAGPVNNLDSVFQSDQVVARAMKVSMPYPDTPTGQVDLIGNPLKFSLTPVSYDRAPPRCGEHTEEILDELRSKKDH